MEPFSPKTREPKPKRRHINCDLADHEYDQVVKAAASAGVPIRSFARQAIFYAMTHMEKKEAESLLLEHKP